MTTILKNWFNTLKPVAGKVKKDLPQKLIMREYIENKLYYDNDGYYSNEAKNFKNFSPIGRLENPLEFSKMRGISDYGRELNLKYPKSTWLTYPELLKPFFGYSLGNYMIKNQKPGQGIKIVEVGSGMGGAIDSILEYLKRFSIKHYKEVEYLGFELNESLCNSTIELLKKNHPMLYETGQITIMNKSIYDYNYSNIFEQEVFVLSLNFIDSTGHDKVKFEKNFESCFTNSLKQFFYSYDCQLNSVDIAKSFFEKFFNENKNLILESHVIRENGILKEKYCQLEDEMLKKMLVFYLMPNEFRVNFLGKTFMDLELQRKRRNEEWFVRVLKRIFSFNSYDRVWLPTNSMNFFETINNIFPNHKLILMDYDFIPSKLFGSDYKGKNCPAVYSIKENSYESITHKSIFDSFESVGKPVNVYFPVDFELLQLIYYLMTKKTASVNKNSYFMKQNSLDEWCETGSGFNPLLQTHNNVSFLLTI